MVQDYLAYIIIALAFAAFARKILGFFNVFAKKQVKSGNCAGCSTGCEMKNTSVLLNKRSGKRSQYQYYL